MTTGIRAEPAWQIVLRAACSEDHDLLLAWRNDPSTYRYTLTPHPVTREEHRRWFSARIAEPCLWVALCDDVPVGRARLDRAGDHLVLDYAVASEARGKGIGTAILREAQRFLAKSAEYHGMAVLAQVNRENLASIAALQRAGWAEAADSLTGFIDLWWRNG